VREIDDLLPRNAREEVFVAARKANNFVRKYRTTDDQVIVIQDQPVKPDRHIFRQATVRNTPDLLRGYQANLHKRLRGFPVMVKNTALTSFSVFDPATNQVAQLVIIHGLVGPKRDQIIQGSHPTGKMFFKQIEHQRHRHAARAVRDQEQYTLTVQLQT